MTSEEIIEYLKRQYSTDVAAYGWYSENIGQPFAEGPVGRAISKAAEPAKRFFSGYMGDTVESGPAYELGKIVGTPHPLNPAAAPKAAMKGGAAVAGMLAVGVDDFPRLKALTKRYRSLGKADQKTMRKQLEAEGLVVDPSTDHVSYWIDPRKVQTDIPDTGRAKVGDIARGPEATRMFDLRPDLADIDVTFNPGLRGGSYQLPSDLNPYGHMNLGTNRAGGVLWTPEKTFFHELEHAAYGRELAGGNTGMFNQLLGNRLWTPGVRLSTYRKAKPFDDFIQGQGMDYKGLVNPDTGEWTPAGKKAAEKWARNEERRGAMPEDTEDSLNTFRTLATEGDIERGLRNPKRHERLAKEIEQEGAKMRAFYQSIGALDGQRGVSAEKAYRNIAGEVAADFAGEYPHFMLTNPHLKDANPYDVFPIWTQARGLNPIGWDDILTRYHNTTGYGGDLPDYFLDAVKPTGMLK